MRPVSEAEMAIIIVGVAITIFFVVASLVFIIAVMAREKIKQMKSRGK